MTDLTDLTDTEIVAACARAMGYEYQWITSLKCERMIVNESFANGATSNYNPLQDDAQAMALIHKFKIGLSYGAEGWIADGPASHHLEQDLNRAICKCVARMQIEKEKNANG